MTMAKDTVCGIQVQMETARWTVEHAGQTFYFCSPGCLKSFEQDPERYANAMEHGDHGHTRH